MPHTTHSYPFEAMVYSYAYDVARRLTSQERMRGFLMLFDADGEIASIRFHVPEVFEELQRLTEAEKPYVFLDPLDDGMEYVYLSWNRIPRAWMERLVGAQFTPDTLTPGNQYLHSHSKPKLASFPESWGVMF